MMLLEFIGLPGAGKSTLMLPLIDLLDRSQINTKNFIEFHCVFMRKKKAKFGFLVFLALNISKVLGLTLGMKREIWKCGELRSRVFKHLVLLYSIKKFISTDKNAIFIFDQGIIQMIASISLLLRPEKLDFNTFYIKSLDIISVEKMDYKIVKVEISIESSIIRIRERKKPTCEFKSMPQCELQKTLRYYERILAKVQPSWIVSSETASVANNASIIFNRLTQICSPLK